MQSTPDERELSRVGIPQGEIDHRATGPADSRHPPVVFVHGLLVDHRLWTDVADRLAARGIRSYAPGWPLGSHRIPMAADADLSPRGMADVIKGFLTAMSLDDLTLVGSDTGGNCVSSQSTLTSIGERAKSRAPASASNRLTARLSGGWLMCSRVAARPKWSSSARHAEGDPQPARSSST